MRRSWQIFIKLVCRKLGPISNQIELDGNGNGNGNQVWFTLPSYEFRSVTEKEGEVLKRWSRGWIKQGSRGSGRWWSI